MVLTIQFTPSHAYPLISTCLLCSYAFLIYHSMAFYFHLVKIIPSFHQCNLHLIPLQLHFRSPQLATRTVGRSYCILVFSHSSVGKESARNAGDPCSIPGLGRSPGEGNRNPLQHSCLENPMDRGAWQAVVQGVTWVGHDLATKLPAPLHIGFGR